MHRSKNVIVAGVLAVVIIAAGAYAYSAKQTSDRNAAKMAQDAKMQAEAKMKADAMQPTPTPDAMTKATPTPTPDAMMKEATPTPDAMKPGQ
jgi:sRNA-binding protein